MNEVCKPESSLIVLESIKMSQASITNTIAKYFRTANPREKNNRVQSIYPY